MKQRLHFLMALVLALCLTAPALAAGFTDVPDSHWASGYIQRAYEEDWVHGMGSGKYAPAGTLTRAQFLTMVTNAFFSDDLDKVSVPDGSPWYAACWSVAQANGLQTGTSMERLSDLTDSVSRYDMAQVIVNTLSGEGISASDSEARAAQAAIRDWSGVPAGYRDAVSGAYALGILNGRNGSFDGTATMNRAEAATVLCRMDDAISGAQTPDTQTPDTQKPDTQKPETQPPAQDASTPEELAAEVVRLVNVERAKEGLPALGTFDSLTKAAEIRAPETAKLFSHNRPDGSSCFTALDATGASKGAYTSGENIAAGSSTAADVVEQWMNSPGHRANILNKDFTHIGVGYCKSGSGYGHYWVQMFVGTKSVPDSGSTQNPGAQAGSVKSTIAEPMPAAKEPVMGPKSSAERMHMVFPSWIAVLPKGLGMGMLANLVSANTIAERTPMRVILCTVKNFFFSIGNASCCILIGYKMLSIESGTGSSGQKELPSGRGSRVRRRTRPPRRPAGSGRAASRWRTPACCRGRPGPRSSPPP